MTNDYLIIGGKLRYYFMNFLFLELLIKMSQLKRKVMLEAMLEVMLVIILEVTVSFYSYILSCCSVIVIYRYALGLFCGSCDRYPFCDLIYMFTPISLPL